VSSYLKATKKRTPKKRKEKPLREGGTLKKYCYFVTCDLMRKAVSKKSRRMNQKKICITGELKRERERKISETKGGRRKEDGVDCTASQNFMGTLWGGKRLATLRRGLPALRAEEKGTWLICPHHREEVAVTGGAVLLSSGPRHKSKLSTIES